MCAGAMVHARVGTLIANTPPAGYIGCAAAIRARGIHHVIESRGYFCAPPPTVSSVSHLPPFTT